MLESRRAHSRQEYAGARWNSSMLGLASLSSRLSVQATLTGPRQASAVKSALYAAVAYARADVAACAAGTANWGA
jgi:hypothetical protein